MLAKEAHHWAGEEETGGYVGWKDKTEGIQDGGEDRVLLVEAGGGRTGRK